MKFEQFRHCVVSLWESYFAEITSGRWRLGLSGVPLFPQQIYFTECKDHYIYELVGGSRKFCGIAPKMKSKKKFSKLGCSNYFNLFQTKKTERSDCVFQVGDGGAFINLSILANIDPSDVKRRFPILNIYSTHIKCTNGISNIFKIDGNVKKFFIENCLIAQESENHIRARNILFSGVFSKFLTTKDIKDFHRTLFWQPIPGETLRLRGVFTSIDNSDSDLFLASQFQNLFLSFGVLENSIGSFLASNPNFTKRLFMTSNFLHECSLEWIEGQPEEEKFIRPDFFIQRPDGFFDIVDLKLALIERKKITKKERKRRDFVHDVRDGIAQLANYHEYFNFDKNRFYAKERFGISVKDPNLFLLVGNVENFEETEVQEALRSSKTNYHIISYDAILKNIFDKQSR